MSTDPNAYYFDAYAVESYDTFVSAAGAGSPLEGDVAFYLDCARRFGSPVLELGTGTGRVLLPLAEAGYEVWGLDLSPAMLAVAGRKLAARPELAGRARLIEADMTGFELGHRFPLALIPARAFQHVLDPYRQQAALTCIRKHLEPGGHLVLDLFDPRLDTVVEGGPKPVPVRERHDPDSGKLLRRTVIERRCDPMRQTIEESLRFDEVGPDGGVIRRGESSWVLRWTLRQEMRWLLELSGFEPVAEYSDFRGSPPAYAREQLWVARVAGAERSCG
ncbi:class I SAM-dependent methyltransferase [Thalassobaculum sp.]|uniref:class I SAM-dependent methyltransferase n=1 Tax=Thalassobaculum sp. TaxID=2022740 RepID=UPI0032EED63A